MSMPRVHTSELDGLRLCQCNAADLSDFHLPKSTISLHVNVFMQCGDGKEARGEACAPRWTVPSGHIPSNESRRSESRHQSADLNRGGVHAPGKVTTVTTRVRERPGRAVAAIRSSDNHKKESPICLRLADVSVAL
ncbi:unnamed protein product [Pleuronectes platessa]|uniref:Uncharacterized protein n=1 Tax=Pleuronectes platessa TaxID=8262 RepID=A0A9N7VLD6_PLEPL|nr:unnamed protein product [Pleuronectes platessa]